MVGARNGGARPAATRHAWDDSNIDADMRRHNTSCRRHERADIASMARDEIAFTRIAGLRHLFPKYRWEGLRYSQRGRRVSTQRRQIFASVAAWRGVIHLQAAGKPIFSRGIGFDIGLMIAPCDFAGTLASAAVACIKIELWRYARQAVMIFFFLLISSNNHPCLPEKR